MVKQFITDQTGISIGLVLSFIGGVLWLSEMHAETIANAKALQEISEQQTEYNHNIIEINTRLSRIEGALGVKHGR